MNTDTGEIVKLLNSVKPPKGFKPVPKEHEAEAEKILDGKESATADMTKDTPLVQWAKSQQHHAKPNNRKAMQRASKKRNR